MKIKSTHGGFDVRTGGDEKLIIYFAWPKLEDQAQTQPLTLFLTCRVYLRISLKFIAAHFRANPILNLRLVCSLGIMATQIYQGLFPLGGGGGLWAREARTLLWAWGWLVHVCVQRWGLTNITMPTNHKCGHSGWCLWAFQDLNWLRVSSYKNKKLPKWISNQLFQTFQEYLGKVLCEYQPGGCHLL